MRRMTQLGFASEDNGIYRFLPPMHRFLDVCLSVQQDRDLAASLHSVLPLPTPALVDDDSEDDILLIDGEDDGDIPPLPVVNVAVVEEESEEQALARALAEERADQEFDA